MTAQTLHFLKAIGFTPEEIDHISKKTHNTANLLPQRFMLQLERNKYHKLPCGRGYRKMKAEDFTRIVEHFKEQVLSDPLRAIAKLAKGNILK